MFNSSVISIGREIISGITTDTNSSFIAKKLYDMGFYNRFIISVDDCEEDIISAIKYYLNKVDVIITTGGLGPTFDDMTLSCIAKALNRKLELNTKALEMVEKFYSDLYRSNMIASPNMNYKRKKMAYLPKGSIPLRNSVGAACGAYIQEDNKHIFCLPGVPKEMKPMLENEVLSRIKPLSTSIRISRTYDFAINDETILSKFIDKIKDNQVYIKSLPTGFGFKNIGVRFTASGKTKEEALAKIEAKRKELQKLIP